MAGVRVKIPHLKEVDMVLDEGGNLLAFADDLAFNRPQHNDVSYLDTSSNTTRSSRISMYFKKENYLLVRPENLALILP